MVESTQSQQSGVSDPTHQDRDIRLKPVVVSMAVILVVASVSAGFVAWLFSAYEKNMYNTRPIASPLATERQLPPAPILQVDEVADLAKYESYMKDLLYSYGWIDIVEKKVRIPVDLAMDRVVSKGLPVRGKAATSESIGSGNEDAL